MTWDHGDALVLQRIAIKRGERRLAVAKLIYSAIMSLDGYSVDEEGKFEWGVPDEEVHAFINELERPIATH